MRRPRRFLDTFVVLFVTSLFTTPLIAQQWSWPDKGGNLQVLPGDIDGDGLRETMMGFVNALGVDCNHCHVGSGNDLSQFDFKADDKETKKTARVMLTMVRAINDEHLAKIDRDDRLEVRCATCHHGQTRPQRIEDVLMDAYSEGEVDAVLRKYRELRARYYGGAAFDFSEPILIGLVQGLPSGKESDAIAILELNSQMYPTSYRTYHYLGELHRLLGHDKAALEAFVQSLEFNPENPVAQQRVEELKAKIPPEESEPVDPVDPGVD